MSPDVIVEEARRIRDALVKRNGGLDGWIDHLQAMDREHRRKAKRPNAKKPASKTKVKTIPL